MSGQPALPAATVLVGGGVLLGFQLAGETLARSLALPLPGPVIGLIGLFLAGLLLKKLPVEVERAADALIAVLPLLFVPAGVGVVAQWGVLKDHALAIAAIILLSTAFTLAVTAAVFVLARKLQRGRPGRAASSGGGSGEGTGG